MRFEDREPGSPTPPWERLLRLILPAGPLGASILGDLREGYTSRAAVSERDARRWYRRAAVSVAFWCIVRRLRFRRSQSTRETPDSFPAPSAASSLSAIRDVAKSALRSVRRSPQLAVAITAVLTMGLGANVTIFGIVDRLLLSPPDGIRDPDGVRRLLVERPSIVGRERQVMASLTYPDYQEFRKLSTFTQVAAYTGALQLTMGRGASASPIQAKTASPDFFELLGVEPVLGRLFTAEDAAAGAEPTVVLTESFWQRRFARDPGVLGRTVDIGEGTYTVIGVTPAGFIGVDLTPVDVFLEFHARARIEMGTSEWRESRNWWWVWVVARLADGVDASAADAATTAAFRVARPPEHAGTQRMLSSSLVLADSPRAPSELEVTRWLAGVSILVLMIACANVANLLLVRATRRRQELAVQRAIGLSRRRLVAQVLTESLIFAAIGGVAALGVAQWGGAALRAELFPHIDFQSIVYNWRTLVFTVAAVIATACLAGLSPALRSSRVNILATLKDGARGASTHRMPVRSGFVAIQAGLTIVLLIGAGLFVRSLRAALSVDLGFDAEVLWTASLEIDADPPADQKIDTYYRALDELRKLPWVEAASFTNGGPFQGSLQVRLAVEGWDSLPQAPGGGPYAYPVAAGYFETLGIEVVRGRALSIEDDRPDGPRVAAVNETMARILWPEGDALGRCLFIREGPCSEVVAVVGNHARGDLVEAPSMMFYVPFRQALNQPAHTLLVRTAGAGDAPTASLRSTLMNVSNDVRWVSVRSYREILEPEVRSWRLGAAVFSAFGLLAMLVAATGLYSSLAYEVADRRRELGIRAALGAPAGRLLRAVVRDTVAAASIGVVGGMALTVPLAHALEGLLFRVSALDPIAYASAVASVIALAALSAAAPSWRAARANPIVALRSQ